MSATIVEVDPFDDAQVDAWHAAYLASEGGLPEGVASTWQVEEVRVLLQEQGGAYDHRGYATVVDGRTVVSGWLEMPVRDNLDRAQVAVQVVPEMQRRGLGSAMLAHLERVAAGLGRTILVGEGSWAYAAPSDGAGEPAAEFARRHGYDLALGDVKRRLALPAAAGLLAGLAAEAAAHHAGYELRSWEGPVPEDLVDGWAALTSSLTTEAPVGDLHLEPEVADRARVREGEATLARQGRRKYNTVALDAGGAVVAYTDLATTVHEPGRAYQWGTLVRRGARGHRLGLGVKVANLRLLEELRPDIREVLTYNAEVNAHMIGVNERLGFVPVSRLGEFQKRTKKEGPTG